MLALHKFRGVLTSMNESLVKSSPAFNTNISNNFTSPKYITFSYSGSNRKSYNRNFSTEQSQDDVSPQVEELCNKILNLPFGEAVKLNQLLRKRLGMPAFSALNHVGAGAPPPPPPSGAPAGNSGGSSGETASDSSTQAAKVETPKKKTFDVKLEEFPVLSKFKLLKEFRRLDPSIDLNTAKGFMDNCPKVIVTGLSEKDAENWKKSLTDCGATVSLV